MASGEKFGDKVAGFAERIIDVTGWKDFLGLIIEELGFMGKTAVLFTDTSGGPYDAKQYLIVVCKSAEPDIFTKASLGMLDPSEDPLGEDRPDVDVDPAAPSSPSGQTTHDEPVLSSSILGPSDIVGL